jgi:hypothetical protein
MRRSQEGSGVFSMRVAISRLHPRFFCLLKNRIVAKSVSPVL